MRFRFRSALDRNKTGMLSYTELKPGIIIVWKGEPFEVLEVRFVRMQQRKAVVQTKMKNLISGKVLSNSFQPSDRIEEAEIERKAAMFIYSHRGEFWFSDPDDPSKRFSLKEGVLGDAVLFLKQDGEVTTVRFNDAVVRIELPVKVDVKVIEAPPAVRGGTAQGGNKVVMLETGAKLTVPMFIGTGDVVRVNTEKGEYVERVTKA